MKEKKVYYRKFGLLLKNEFKARQMRNSNYSLRALAKDLSISSSALSDFINNKKNPSEKMIKKIGEALGLDETALSPYLTLAMEADSEKDLFKGPIPELANKLSLSQLERRKLLSNIYHYAVLELFHFPDFIPEVEWVAKKLKLSLEETYDRVSHAPDFASFTASKENNEDIKINQQLQKQALENAMDALLKLSYNEIDQTMIMFPVNKDKLPYIKQRIAQFRRELAAEMIQDGEHYNSLYQLSFSAFPLTLDPEV